MKSTGFWFFLAVLFTVAPIIFQWIRSGFSDPLATLKEIFPGEIDWQAWWAFGTFLIALVAALIAYREYNSHIRAMQPLVVPHVEDKKLLLTNVGGGIAIKITCELDPGLALKNGGTSKALRPNIPLLKPNEDIEVHHTLPLIDMAEGKANEQKKQTLHVKWEDSAGQQNTDNTLKLNYSNMQGFTADTL